MAASDYVVVDFKQEAPTVAPAPSAQPAEVVIPTIERATLEDSDAAGERSAGRLVVEPMPFKLIEPVSVDAAPAAATAWGIGAVGADTSPMTGSGVSVAVLDTGIDATHPAFTGVNITERDFTTEGNGDTHGHGTHCAGTIVGRDVNGTRIGVARGVTDLLIGKVLGAGGGGTDSIAEAVLWAVQNGANVVSMSLGIDFPGFVAQLTGAGWPVEAATSRALAAYRDNLRLLESLAQFVRSSSQFGRSAILVAAAGNESARTAANPYTVDLAPPSASDGFVSVAAVGQAGGGFDVAWFSNTGAMISGPGVDVVSAAPGGALASMSGTSMATPHVAGVAALWAERLLTQSGTIAPDLLIDRLIGNSATLPGLARGDVGAGLVRSPA